MDNTSAPNNNKAYTYRYEDLDKVYQAIGKHVPFIEAENAIKILRSPLQISNLVEKGAELETPKTEETQSQTEAPVQEPAPQG